MGQFAIGGPLDLVIGSTMVVFYFFFLDCGCLRMIYMLYSYVDNQQEGLFFGLLYLESGTQKKLLML